MPLYDELGTSNSQLGDIQLGLNPNVVNQTFYDQLGTPNSQLGSIEIGLLPNFIGLGIVYGTSTATATGQETALTTGSISSTSTTSTFPRGVYGSPNYTQGYVVGGINNSYSVVATADKIDFGTDTTTAQTSANLSTARNNLAGVSDTIDGKGYFAGGCTGIGSGFVTTVDKIIYSNSTTAAQTTAVLSQARSGLAAVSDNTDAFGIIAGGSDGSNVATADQLFYSNDTISAQTTANLSQARFGLAGISDNTDGKGYFAGGNVNYSGDNEVATAEKITYSTDTTAAQTTANLTQARYVLAGIGDDSDGKGYWAGGWTNPGFVLTDKITYSTDTTAAQTTANLTQAKGFVAGVSGAEISAVGNPKVRLTQYPVEVLITKSTPKVRLTQYPVEILYKTPNVGTASGTSTVNGVGQLITTGIGSASGTSTANGIQPFIQSIGSASGQDASEGIGSEFQDGIGTASGTSTVNGVGQLITTCIGSASGTSTVNGISSEFQNSIGSASGTSTVNGVSPIAGIGVGSASGQDSTNGVGQLAILGTGIASGTSIVSGIGQYFTSSAGVASGQDSSNGVGSEFYNSVGSASGTSTVIGAQPIEQSIGSANGQDTSNGVGQTFNQSVGISYCTSLANGIPGFANGVGSTTGTSTANGLGQFTSILPQPGSVTLWLQADKGTALGTINDVITWNDQSANIRNASQSSTFSRPKLISNALNGLPILRFNGSTSFMSVGNSSYMINGIWTIFALVSDNRSDLNQKQIISNVAMDSQETAVYLGTVGESPTKAVMTDDFGGQYDSQGDTTGQGTLDITATDEGGYFILVGEVEGSNFTPYIYENDLLVAAGNPSDYSLSDRDFSNPYYIGRAGYSSSNYWTGDIAEIIVYNGISLDNSDFETVINYLKLKWFDHVPVAQTVSTTWNDDAATTVSVSINTSWNDEELPYCIATAIWVDYSNPPTTVDVGPQGTSWNDHQLVSQTASATWNVDQYPITDVSISTSWNDLHRPITDKSISTSWNDSALGSVTPTNTIWNILTSRKKIRTVLWDDETYISISISTNWNDYELVGQTVSTTWNDRKLVDLIAFPEPAERSRWNVEQESDLEGDTIAIAQYTEWNDIAHVSFIHEALWNDYGFSYKTNITTWNVRADVYITNDTQWNDLDYVDITRETSWYSIPLTFEKFTFWNDRTLVVKPINTLWKSIKNNNTGTYAIWNDDVFVSVVVTATWDDRVPVSFSVSTIWNDRAESGNYRLASWNDLRTKLWLMTTYWNVMYGKSMCTLSNTSDTSPVLIRVGVRWDVSQISSDVTRFARWNNESAVINPPQRMAEWRNLMNVYNQSSTIWRVTKYTTDISISTYWAGSLNVNAQRIVDWNDRQLQVGSSQRSTTWDAEIFVGDSIGTIWNESANVYVQATATWVESVRIISTTSWNDHEAIDKTISTTWADSLGVILTSNTFWKVNQIVLITGEVTYNDLKSVDINNDTLWNEQNEVTIQSSSSWIVRQLVSDTVETSWDYSVVSVSSNTMWNDKVKVNSNRYGIATLWDVFQNCSAEYVKHALLPKITVCDLEYDRINLGYNSKYDRTSKRISRRSRR